MDRTDTHRARTDGAAQVSHATMRQVVALATLAPSVHNTQPWRWRASGHVLELHADRRHQLMATDPDGRELVISCGAALRQAEVAAGALGWTTRVARFPDPSRPDLLACLHLTPGSPHPGAGDLLDALAKRCTDRRRFTSWPVPEDRLSHLAQTAHQAGARAVALNDVSERFRAERLILRAAVEQRALRAVMEEHEVWRDRSASDGVPSEVVPVRPRPGYTDRFGDGDLEDMGDREIEGSDGLIVLFDATDDPRSWLLAGEGLTAMWLAATTSGLSVVPLSQVIEVDETRKAFQLEVLGGLAHPLLLARVGWQAIGRSELARTPRRPVDEVLELA